jgi:predicted porin
MKKLLVIAVAAALAAPAAMADTTLYGKLHASVGSVKTTTAGVTSTTNRVDSNASRIGIKGATALDNGMEATYGLEYGINLDGVGGTGAGNTQNLAAGSTLEARNTFVGLKGKFGEVRVGRHDTPGKLATAGLDVFADTAADMSTLIQQDGGTLGRVNNAVAYINKFGPVTFAAAHATNPLGAEVAAPAIASNNANTLMAAYGNGPWTASVGSTSVQNTSKSTSLGLGWKAEAGHNVGLVAENTTWKKNTGLDLAVAGVPVASAVDTKDKAIYLAGGYKMGNVTLKAAVGNRKHSGDATVTNNGKEKLTALGADYSLGKKTSVYLLASDNKNTNANTVAAAQNRVKTTAVGLVTEF